VRRARSFEEEHQNIRTSFLRALRTFVVKIGLRLAALPLRETIPLAQTHAIEQAGTELTMMSS
jgi:hypothetical protein